MRFTKYLGAAAMSLVFAAPAFAEDIKIAVAGPMTGPLAFIGDQFRQGAVAAGEAINAKGGLNGRKVQIIVEDDMCDPKQAVAVANRVVANGIHFVDGHACSGSSLPASQVYAENGVLMITPASSSPELTEAAATKGWSTIMRLYIRDDSGGNFAGTWLADHYKDKVIAILHDKGPYGQGAAEVVKAKLNEKGIKEVLFEGINPGEKDYSVIVSKLKDAKADAVYFGGYHPEAALMLRQAAEQGYKFQLVMPDSIASTDFWTTAGTAGEGTMFAFPADPQARPDAKEAVEKIKAGGFTPEGFTLFSYAVIEAIVQGIDRAGSDDAVKVAEALKNGQAIQTVVGDIVFDEKGDIKDPKFEINQWHDGKYAPIAAQ